VIFINSEGNTIWTCQQIFQNRKPISCYTMHTWSWNLMQTE